jgi:DNA-binding GntR family transcriptional regulator
MTYVAASDRYNDKMPCAPGKLLPSISMLMQTYGLSDGTVKRALSALRDEGLIETVTGRGSYVADR